MRAYLIATIALVAAFSGAVARAAEKAADPQAGHRMPAMDHSQMDHAAMGHAAAAVSDGPWSYKGRDNPKPHKTGRWEMVPVPGYGHMFITTQGLSRELTCAALDNPGVMVDRATREACGLPAGAVPAKDSGAPVVDHSKMKH